MRTPRPWWFALTVLSVALIALDYATGPRILFPVAFVLPVSLAAWHLGRWPGVGFAVALTGVQFLLLWDPRESLAYAAINAGIRLIVFIGLAGMVARLAAQARELARRVRVLEGVLPICSFCKSVRRPDGKWENIEAYISQRSAALFSHGICEVCGREHYGDAFGKPDADTPGSAA